MSTKYTLKNYMKAFSVMGNFYTLNISQDSNIKNFNCRSLLTIQRNESNIKEPDGVFVMMNPGSSTLVNKSLDPFYYKNKASSFKEEASIPFYTPLDIINQGVPLNLQPAVPDNVQCYVMEIMDLMNWHLVYCINLSDLRNANSSEFKKDVGIFRKSIEFLGKDYLNLHSIFDKHRVLKNNLKNSIIETRLDGLLQSFNIPIICAFGVSNPKYLTDLAVKFFRENNIKPLGKIKDNDLHKFFYLKPIGGKDIVEDLVKEIQES